MPQEVVPQLCCTSFVIFKLYTIEKNWKYIQIERFNVKE